MANSFEDSELVAEAIDEHFLFPSTVFASSTQYRVQTILGSCVAVCLHDQRMQWGGINHYMLPWWNGSGVPSPKYGDIAIERLLEKVSSLGSLKQNFIAKVFGGASQHAFGQNGQGVGARNIEIAESLLDKYQIRIVSKNVGGLQGRKIVFDTRTGQVFMKYL